MKAPIAWRHALAAFIIGAAIAPLHAQDGSAQPRGALAQSGAGVVTPSAAPSATDPSARPPVAGQAAAVPAKTLVQVRFDPGSDNLTAAAMRPLERLLAQFGDRPISVRIVAYADAAENPGPARDLATRRADAVALTMLSGGVFPARLRVSSGGTLATPAGQPAPAAQNRRVDVEVELEVPAPAPVQGGPR